MSATTNATGESRAVSITVGNVLLNGDLVIPPRAISPDGSLTEAESADISRVISNG